MYISASAPDAPPLSDTTMGCFISLFFWIAACIIRAIWSDAPPAPAATTISTGLLGSQASAGALASATASAAALAPKMFLTTGFASLLAFALFDLGPPAENPRRPWWLQRILPLCAHGAR